MSTTHTQPDEEHRSERAGWLRAAVLGANDGLISTAALIVGVAAADSSRSAVIIAGIAGMTAGSLSMAAGEYVSVSSQRDTEQADIARETAELRQFPEAEQAELAAIYESRGLSPATAALVAEELAQHDLLRIHARDELGIDLDNLANPVQASVVSALSFVVGAAVPILVVIGAPAAARVAATMLVTLVGLVALGATGARLGGAPTGRAAVRVLVGGTAALLIALGIGALTGAAV